VPPGLGDARRIVYANGLVEIVCAALLQLPMITAALQVAREA
jgi:hypothetical protein